MVAFVKVSTQFHEHFKTGFYIHILYTWQEGWQRKVRTLHWKDKPVCQCFRVKSNFLHCVRWSLYIHNTVLLFNRSFLNPRKIAATICCYEMKTLYNSQPHVPVTAQLLLPRIFSIYHTNTSPVIQKCILNTQLLLH